MTIATRLFGLIMTAALYVGPAGGAVGEELPIGSDAMPSVSMPALQNGVALPPRTPIDEGSVLAEPGDLAPESLEGYEEFQEMPYDEYAVGQYDLWGGRPAPIDSTGTWLRRGFWYAEADAVIWNRFWNRDDKIYAAEDVNVTSPTFFLQPILVFTSNRLLIVDGAHPGEDTSVRTTIGRFLFRDVKNRDHVAEFTVFGGGDWHQRRSLASEGNFGLFTPFYISGGNRSFDASTRQDIDYSSTFRSFEGNYRVKWRMQEDQLVMDPNGQWSRAANPTWTYEFLAGLRYLEMRDIFNWRAEDIIQLGDDGEYLIRTENDMFGFQLGTGGAYETARWSLGLLAKGGVFANNASGRSTLNFTADDFSDFDRRLAEDQISFIGEARLQGKYHVTPNISLRAAYEMMFLTSIALAPTQANFITEMSKLTTSGDPFYHGASFGIEGYW